MEKTRKEISNVMLYKFGIGKFTSGIEINALLLQDGKCVVQSFSPTLHTLRAATVLFLPTLFSSRYVRTLKMGVLIIR